MISHRFETKVVWKSGKEGTINARRDPEIRVATPPEFGGPPDAWSPLELLVASLTSCYMSTFMNIADKRNLKARSFEADGVGLVDATPEGLRFTRIDVAVRVVVDDEDMAEKVRAAQEPLKKLCPVARGLNFPVNLKMDVSVAVGQ